MAKDRTCIGSIRTIRAIKSAAKKIHKRREGMVATNKGSRTNDENVESADKHQPSFFITANACVSPNHGSKKIGVDVVLNIFRKRQIEGMGRKAKSTRTRVGDDEMMTPIPSSRWYEMPMECLEWSTGQLTSECGG